MLGVVALLVMIGLIMVYSAKLYIDQSYLTEQAKRVALGAAMCMLGYVVPVSWWRWRRAGWWILVATLGALVLVRLSGMKYGGAARTWHGIQPSEFARLGIAIFLAYYYQLMSQLPERERNLWRYLLRPLLFCAPVLALIIVQPAVSTAIIVAVLALSLMYLAEVKLRHLATLGLVGVVLFGTVMLKYSYVRRRAEAYVDTIKHILDIRAALQTTEPVYKTILWQQQQSLIAIGSGGIFGKGLGNSKQKFHFLPKVHTDFIFALIGEEWGVFGSLLIFGLFSIFLWRGMYLALRSPDPFSRLVIAGIVLGISYTAMVHLGANLRLIPPTGQLLPFVSYGGSALGVNMMSVGIVLQLSKRIERRPVEDSLVGRLSRPRWSALSDEPDDHDLASVSSNRWRYPPISSVR
jgi:cell division protein FtsW